MLASRRVDKLKDLRAEIEGQGGDAHVLELDVTDHASIKAAVAHAETEVGSIDISGEQLGRECHPAPAGRDAQRL